MIIITSMSHRTGRMRSTDTRSCELDALWFFGSVGRFGRDEGLLLVDGW